jgi:hypothetical protein
MPQGQFKLANKFPFSCFIVSPEGLLDVQHGIGRLKRLKYLAERFELSS